MNLINSEKLFIQVDFGRWNRWNLWRHLVLLRLWGIYECANIREKFMALCENSFIWFTTFDGSSQHNLLHDMNAMSDSWLYFLMWKNVRNLFLSKFCAIFMKFQRKHQINWIEMVDKLLKNISNSIVSWKIMVNLDEILWNWMTTITNINTKPFALPSNFSPPQLPWKLTVGFSFS